GKGKGKGGNKGPSARDQNRSIGQQIIDTGRAGNPNLGAADDFIGRTLEEGGLGGNEVYQDLYGRLGNASLDDSTDWLEQFLTGEGGMGGGGEPVNRKASARYGSLAPGMSGGGAAFGGTGIGDSTRGGGLFNDWAKDVLGGKFIDPNDPVLKDYLDVIQRQGQEDLDAQLQDVADEFEGVGMYGGSGLALERALARSKGNQGISDARSKALYDFRGQGMDLMGLVGGQVNQRDISAADIAAQERSSANASAASAAASEAANRTQLQIANRGMNLDAIGMLMNNNQFGLEQLAGLGNSIARDRFGAVGAMADTDAARYGGLDRAYGVSRDMAQQDAADRRRAEERRYQNATAGSRHLDEYLNRLGFFNNAGGTTTSRTVGENVVPMTSYGGPDPVSAGLAAGLGTFFTGYGAYGGGQQQAPRGSRPPVNDGQGAYGPARSGYGYMGGG
ncbi:MAG TPA: hypothetical protein VJ725_21430, partial [Thermoanaerobaculia bacterium]|nr:hypothetical protein [Thermoanaerobaculia bacterium]